jgi:hypothetical protein
MSIINFFGDGLDLSTRDELLFTITGSRTSFPEEYRVLKQFNPIEVELSLTHRGRKPSPEAMVEFLIMQGFIKPFRIQ